MFWASPEISRTTGNKKNIIRKQVAAKTYVSHPKQMLDKSHTEVYLDFKNKYPDIEIRQRTIEKCKQFFFKAPREDRILCCFQKSIISEHNQPVNPVLNHLSEIIHQTLFDKQEGKYYHEKKCCIVSVHNVVLTTSSLISRKMIKVIVHTLSGGRSMLFVAKMTLGKIKTLQIV